MIRGSVATNWTYTNTLTYEAAPRPKVHRKKTERVFVPDPPSRSLNPELSQSQLDLQSVQPDLHKSPHAINVTQLTKTRSSGVAPRDEILSRTEKEIHRWRGTWEAGRRYILFPPLNENGEALEGWGSCANVRLGGYDSANNANGEEGKELPPLMGWWIELEVEEVVREERKRLFVWT